MHCLEHHFCLITIIIVIIVIIAITILIIMVIAIIISIIFINIIFIIIIINTIITIWSINQYLKCRLEYNLGTNLFPPLPSESYLPTRPKELWQVQKL